MIKFNIRVDVDGISDKIKNATERAQHEFDQEVLKDANKYIPMDQGILERSSYTHSKLGQGKLIWQTPYARKLYYGEDFNFSTNKNSLAGPMWFERAKSAHLHSWNSIAGKLVKKYL